MDKKREHAEKMNKVRSGIGVIGIVILLLGALAMLYSLGPMSVIEKLVDEEHMTDDGIAYRDLDNATYTYDRAWIENELDTWLNYMLATLVPIMVGIALFYVYMFMPGGRAFHKAHCDGAGEAKYCSECGLKLSRLDQD